MRHLTLSLLFCLFIPGFLAAADPFFDQSDAMSMESETAHYDGKKIILHGQVDVEYKLGIISAEHVEITPETTDKTTNFNYLTMTNDVQFIIRDGGKLNCAYAEIDYSNLEGRFYGNEQQKYVSYADNCIGKNGSSIPLLVKSGHMNIKIVNREIGNKKNRNCIENILADSNVSVSYNNDIVVIADYAIYNPYPIIDAESKKAALISLRASDEKGMCQVTNRQGDLIRASQIDLDTGKQLLSFTYPKGAVHATHNQEKEGRIDFSGDLLIWDEEHNVLTLSGHVIVNQKGMGTLVTDKELYLFQQVKNGEKQLRSIESNGITTLTYTDEEKELLHTLICYGTVVVDHDHLETTMESPRGVDKKVLAGQQIFFKDHMGEIYADKMTVIYKLVEHSPEPIRLILEGNVHLLNRCAIDPEQKGEFLQYAIADKVEYSPQAKEINLSSLGRGRVLFFDKLNNLQVSAPGLTIRRDQMTKKDSIQGSGDVRFSFIEQEFAQIKKYFNLEETKKTEDSKDNT